MPEKTNRGWNCTVAEIAAGFGLTRKTVHDMVAAGLPVVISGKGGRGNPTVINLRDLYEWISGRKSPKNDGKLNRLEEIRIERAELELAERRGDLVHADDFGPFVEDKFVEMRQTLVNDVVIAVRERCGNEAADIVYALNAAALNATARGVKAAPELARKAADRSIG